MRFFQLYMQYDRVDLCSPKENDTLNICKPGSYSFKISEPGKEKFRPPLGQMEHPKPSTETLRGASTQE